MNKLISLSQQQVIVLTANQQLAGHLHQQFRMELNQNSDVLATPSILPIEAWLRTFWGSHLFGEQIVLSQFQEHQLWVQISKHSDMASALQQAWRLLHLWQMDLDNINKIASGSLEVEAFISWAKQFSELCRLRLWISEAELAHQIEQRIIPQDLKGTKELLLAGFEEIAPAYLALFNKIKQWIPVNQLVNPAIESQAGEKKLAAAVFKDSETEVSAATNWIKNKIAQNPDAKVALIDLRLSERQENIQKLFNQLSCKRALAEFEIVSVALKILSLNVHHLPYEILSYLLQSPYLCQNQPDFNIGAMIDAECRQAETIEIPITLIFKAIQKWQNHYPNHTWLTRWRRLFAINLPDQKLLPSQWSHLFVEQLNALGWPGQRVFTLEEYQVITRWQELLEQLNELDVIHGEISKLTAYQCLYQLTTHTLFQAQHNRFSPIQIFDIHQCNGYAFDAIWVMGLNEEHWPCVPTPNPFLPYSLQKKLNIPHSSAEQELAYAQKVTARLLATSEVYLSCSNRLDQSAQFSRLIPLNLKQESTFNDNIPVLNGYEMLFNSKSQEQLLDQMGYPIKTDTVSGGSSVLKRQAECPFQAFAFYRLHATSLDEPQIGISAKTHGNLTHRVLDLLWSDIKNQENLIQMNPATLQQLVENTVQQVINEHFININNVFIEVEKLRLIQVMIEWLNLEKQRPAFRVFAREARKILSLSDLKFNITLDRIDQLENNQLFLIDYKTGSFDTRGWENARLQQPQLPCYAVAVQPNQALSGIAFAQIKSGECKFKGLHQETFEGYFPEQVVSTESWSSLINDWRQSLTKLALEFKTGFAAVAPADNGKPCKNCQLQSLCRIQETFKDYSNENE
ncbi:MAG: PD-(D/E)XK nuclease family protein [Proteobacteria bacterium]|nr:PD-(D/E)XK nuclease family protein [Pseudomonadota bacterium]